MSCGCNRSQTFQKIKKTNNLTKTPIVASLDVMTKRRDACNTCPYSTKITSSRSNIRQCRKSGMLIVILIKDPNYKCPKNKF